MVVAIGMATETARAFGLLLPVLGVAVLAIGVLCRRVKTLQGRGLVTAATGGWPCRATGTVRAVTFVARGRDLAVR